MQKKSLEKGTLAQQWAVQRKKKMVRWLLAIVLGIGVFAGIYLLFFMPVTSRRSETRLTSGGVPVLAIVKEVPGTQFEAKSLLADIPPDFENGIYRYSFGFGDLETSVKCGLIRTAGSTQYYSFRIEDRGIITVIPEFAYSGEEFLVVARGRDWFLHFTRR